MPELPEVENVKLSLQEKLLNRTITNVTIHNPISIKYNDQQDFTNRLTNGRITDISRRGKFLILDITHDKVTDEHPNNLEFFIIHLAMTGAFLYNPTKDSSHHPNNIKNHIFVELTLDDNTQLIYSDYRRFGSLRVVSLEEWETAPYTHLKTLREMGPEPFEPNTEEEFLQRIRQNRYQNKPIKDVLLDQRVIAGAGNIYANECLHPLGINPYEEVQHLTDDQLKQVAKVLQDLLKLSIKMGGTSLKDYVNGEGKSGTFQTVLKVYGKTQCEVCDSPIEKTQLNKRATYHCPFCQSE